MRNKGVDIATQFQFKEDNSFTCIRIYKGPKKYRAPRKRGRVIYSNKIITRKKEYRGKYHFETEKLILEFEKKINCQSKRFEYEFVNNEFKLIEKENTKEGCSDFYTEIYLDRLIATKDFIKDKSVKRGKELLERELKK